MAVAQGCGDPIKDGHLDPTSLAISSNGVSNSVSSQEGQFKKAGHCWLWYGFSQPCPGLCTEG